MINKELEELEKENNVIANQFLLGFVLALIVTFISLVIFNISLKRTITLSEFIHSMMQLKVFSAVLSIAVLPNLVLFFVFLNLKKYKTVRGILTATLLLAIAVFVIKFAL